ncbi:hypothetical protein B5S28_g1383 [[Candida] boidinii]|uniref:Unnamed protein product n=1 Tax=Candida boidinii TaxID=5477 RepID=A0ACB5U3K1_CANBO|nr:hypothetical protein B5S28_g1383 [[Candida] boidinii]OWB60400.1 hypothetical protein B5S29_g1274 [[Candida] boidinii]OWB73454.1 hypothetical protein B5S31_g3196 [[Candida] boidinii]OWB77211.1 hypothetical protein B5S32_g1372 [[Candida] boidinii]GME79793.1 unnamed protein product [[Candida] boidinii]
MPKIRTIKKYRSNPPEGFQKIEPILIKFNNKLKEAESKNIKLNRPKNESLWEIYKLNHQRSRYIYDLYYKKKIISKILYDWLLKNKFGDGDLIAKWKKQGYENLCCIKCINVSESNQGTTCICRVPKATLNKNLAITAIGDSNDDDTSDETSVKLGKEKDIKCMTCGCRGCASSD